MSASLFLHPLGLFTFLFFFGMHCLFSASLLSAVITFGSPEISLFDVYSHFFLFYILRFSFFRCGYSLWAFLLPFEWSYYLSFLLFARFFSFPTSSPVLLPPWFSLLLVFASASSSFFLLSLLRSAFRTPYSHLGWSIFASSSAFVLSLLLGSPSSLCFSLLSLSSGFSASLGDFFCLFVVCLPDCVSLPTALVSYPFHLVCSCFKA